MEKYLDFEYVYDEIKLRNVAIKMRKGGIVLFPTETVYGIGTNGLKSNAVKKIYKMKNRDRKNPINLLVSSIDMVEAIAKDITPLEYKLMQSFFPGPFTIILKKKKIVPDIVTANSDFVGVRMPSNDIARKLVSFAHVPIAAPSANISGRLSVTNLKDFLDEFSHPFHYVINGGESKIGIESTIVKVIDNVPHILRPGSILPEQIEEVAGSVVLEGDTNSLLPSSNIKHYQLDSETLLVYSKENQKMMDKIVSISTQYENPLVLCCTENMDYYSNHGLAKNIMPVGSKNLLSDYCKNLFSTLRKVNTFAPDIVLIEGVEKTGLGIAIMDRLTHVCNGNVMEIE